MINWKVILRYTGVILQLLSPLPMVAHLVWETMIYAHKGMEHAYGYQAGAEIHWVVLILALFLGFTLLGLGRWLCGQWKTNIVAVYLTIFALQVVRGFALHATIYNIESCGKSFC